MCEGVWGSEVLEGGRGVLGEGDTTLSYATVDLVTTKSVEWQTSVNKFEAPVIIEASSTVPFDETISVSCSIGGLTSITYTLTGADAKSEASWITFTEGNFSLTGSPPESNEDQTYNYYMVASWTNAPSGTSTTKITFNVKAKPVPPVVPEIEPESKITTTSSQTAVIVAQVQVGLVTVLAIANAVLNGTPPTSLWSVIQHLQMILLFMLIDEYTPVGINEFIEGISFVLFNFSFLPMKKIPLLDIPTIKHPKC